MKMISPALPTFPKKIVTSDGDSVVHMGESTPYLEFSLPDWYLAQSPQDDAPWQKLCRDASDGSRSNEYISTAIANMLLRQGCTCAVLGICEGGVGVSHGWQLRFRTNMHFEWQHHRHSTTHPNVIVMVAESGFDRMSRDGLSFAAACVTQALIELMRCVFVKGNIVHELEFDMYESTKAKQKELDREHYEAEMRKAKRQCKNA
jgi:hypothetical protein